MKHFLAMIPVVFSTVFSLAQAEALPAEKRGDLNRVPLKPLHVAESRGQWLQAEDFEGIQAQFKNSLDDRQKPIVLKRNSSSSDKVTGIAKGASGRSELDFTTEVVFAHTIHNEESRCVFYQVKTVSGREAAKAEGTRLLPAEKKSKSKQKLNVLDTWSYNKSEEVPKIWEEPGIFPLSFSMTSKGRLLNVLCATKKHVKTDGKAAFTSYAMLLANHNVDLKKNGREFKSYREETKATTVVQKSQAMKPAAQN